ncbi:hypothetical protein ACFQU2_39805 [Siccirubricoccus deserti]
MASREGALTRAAAFFDEGSFRALLTDLVAIPSTAQEPGFEPELDRYLRQAITPGSTGSASPRPSTPTRWMASARS